MNASLASGEIVILEDYFPLHSKVRDMLGKVGVVVGYEDGKLLVLQTGTPETGDLVPLPIAPKHLSRVPVRVELSDLLAAVEQAIVRAAKSGMADGVLQLAQAREIIGRG